MPARRTDAYATLLDEITTWRLAPGSPLREEHLASRLGVSRTPVREALARLRSEGLVEQQPGQIATVAPVGIDSTIAVYQARDALESYAVQLAARSAQRTLFEPLRDAYAALAEDTGGRTDELYRVSDEFDDAVRRAVPNPYLLGPLEVSRVALLRLRRLAALDPARLAAAARQRADECRAIVAGDAAAAGRLSHERIEASLQHAVSALLDGRTAPYVTPTLQ